MDKTWSQRIRELEATNWSLTGLGVEVGLSAQALSDIKQGRTKAPTGMAAVKLYELHKAIDPKRAPAKRQKAAA